MSRSPTYCVLPHLALAVQNYGDICACNVNKQSFELDGKPYTVDQGPLKPIWHSVTRQEIIKSLDNGERHPSCRACWDVEDAGNFSVRQDFNQKLSHIVPDTDQPRVLIIKPGNTCNAACRMCNPATSSSWYQDDFKRQKIKNKDLDFKIYIKDFESIRNSFNKNNPTFWPTISDWYDKIEMMDIYGGEPWLIEGLWTSIEHAVSQGHSKHIDICLNTNASIWNVDYMELLSNFRSVLIKLSFDSHVKKQFEYIRHKLDFDLCFENAKKFIKFGKGNSKVFSLFCMVSPTNLNIHNLDEIYLNLKQSLDIDVAVTNFVTGPDEYYDIRHLPKKIKRDILNRFQNNSNLAAVRNFLNQSIPGCSIYWPKFCMETDRLDKIRDQSFQETMPEWWAQLEPYWDYKKHHPEWF